MNIGKLAYEIKTCTSVRGQHKIVSYRSKMNKMSAASKPVDVFLIRRFS